MPDPQPKNSFLIGGASPLGLLPEEDDKNPPPRLEIHDLRLNEIQFSLFIRAFNKLLDKKSDYGARWSEYAQHPESWWQIGGIHGLPYEPWSGDPKGKLEPADPTSQAGYCFHGSVLFPTWHRVQLLLVEQALVREAKEFVSNLHTGPQLVEEERKKWQDAAEILRLPYWDWTSDQTAKQGIPEIFRWPKIFILNPEGLADDEVPNPLNHYRFPDNHKPFSAEPVASALGTWSRTYRWADFDYNPPRENYNKARSALQKGGGPYRDPDEVVTSLRLKVAGLFNYPLLERVDAKYKQNLWGRFSNTNSSGIYVPEERYKGLASLEAPHNDVHLDVGGFGTMAFNDFASFDPIFFLHHCNVDRIYAFWEWLYSEYWVGDGKWTDEDGSRKPFKSGSNWSHDSRDESALLDATTPLLPFRITEETYWTSNNARGLYEIGKDWKPKYYTYPALKDKKTGITIQPHLKPDANTPPEQYRQALYNQWGTDLATEVRTIRRLTSQYNWSDELKTLLLEDSKKVHNLRNFSISGGLPEFAFGGSYRLELYLSKGDVETAQNRKLINPSPNNDSQEYVIDNISVFARLDPSHCPECQDRQAGGSLVVGTINLDPRLIIVLVGIAKPDNAPQDWNLSLEELYGQIEQKIRPRLVHSDGRIIADTEPTDLTVRKPLDKDKKPWLWLDWHRIEFDDEQVGKQVQEQATHIDLDLTKEDSSFRKGFKENVEWRLVKDDSLTDIAR